LSLEIAFQGANVIFGVTDFWTIFQDPTSVTTKKPAQDLTQFCYEVEVGQGKHLANAAAATKTLDRFVFSSMAMASKWSNEKFSQIYHMDSKAVVAEYAETLPGLKSKFSQIQAPIYFNLLWQWALPTTPKKVSDSSS
jgi:NmrA-like family